MQNSTRAGVALLVFLVLLLNSTDRYHIAPSWMDNVAFGVLVVAMGVAAFVRTPPFRRIERIAMWVVVTLGLIYNTYNLATVIYRLVFQAVQPSTLFFTAVTIWIDNIIIFALTYWLIDGGGPHARTSGATAYSDFDFPAYEDPGKVPAHWLPGLVDYLFLGFTTATAFSPTEAQPLTPRAKLLMMAESTISLATIAIVAARAINIIK